MYIWCFYSLFFFFWIYFYFSQLYSFAFFFYRTPNIPYYEENRQALRFKNVQFFREFIYQIKQMVIFRNLKQ